MNIRSTYIFGFTIICLLLLASVYIQVFQGFNPCPLCTLQRLAFASLGIIFFVGIFAYRRRLARMVINLLLMLTSLTGLGLAARQVWLQYFPAAANGECGVNLEYMMKVLPVNKVLEKTLEGSAECTERSWEFLHLSMAEWSLIFFVLFLIGAVFLLMEELLRQKHK